MILKCAEYHILLHGPPRTERTKLEGKPPQTLCSYHVTVVFPPNQVGSLLTKIDGEPVCVTCDVRSRLMENQFASPVMCAPD
ncbi:hypothetical protein RRG08_047361 [Elysia crispata]|uniref:Uncharacterized protein n=1 Tax=Elysia crispata TaxID=231223 RepID=A0AAE1D4P6_9GAST|nr:hypothetical protein RRG08_047361 [Elysia crispata]